VNPCGNNPLQISKGSQNYRTIFLIFNRSQEAVAKNTENLTIEDLGLEMIRSVLRLGNFQSCLTNFTAPICNFMRWPFTGSFILAGRCGLYQKSTIMGSFPKKGNWFFTPGNLQG